MTRKTGAHHCRTERENKCLGGKNSHDFTVFLEHDN